MAAGRMFTSAEGRGRRKVAVLGGEVLTSLDVATPEAIIGENIRIGGRQFEVIGVLAKKGATGFGDGDNQVLIPIETGRFGVLGTDRQNYVWARAGNED
jgi:putative ABC transport system permease protein